MKTNNNPMPAGSIPAPADVVSTPRLSLADPFKSARAMGRVALCLIAAGAFAVSSARAQVWTATGNLNAVKTGANATLLPNGKVLIAGGSGTGAPVTTAELYDPATGTFTPTGSMAIGRTNFYQGEFGVLLANGKVAFIAGSNGFTPLATAEIYDPATGAFSPTGNLAAARVDHAIVRLDNGKVLAVGGQDAGFVPLASAEIYDPVSGTFSSTGSMSVGRDIPTATLLGNGKVLVTGGFPGLTSAELYDPVTGTFSPTGSMLEGRHNHRALLLPNGKVLVTGGANNNGNNVLATAELYDPVAGTFSATGSMATIRGGGSSMTLLPSGEVLVAGGTNGGVNFAELYHPASGTFSVTTNMNTGRYAHTATLLPNGAVLVTGGQPFGSIVLATAELFSSAVVETLYVSNSGNNTISRITAAGAVSHFANTGNPWGLAFDGTGDLLVVNSWGVNSITKFTPAGAGSSFAATNSGVVTLNVPEGLALDAAGNLFVANNNSHQIVKFTRYGVGSTFASGGFSSPGAVAFDRAGNLYVADTANHTILKFAPDGAGSIFASTLLNSPGGLAFDAVGNLYVSNTNNNNIVVFTPAGVGTVFATTGLDQPHGLAFDFAGNLYAANYINNTITKFTPGGVPSLFANTGLSQPTFVAFKTAPAVDTTPPVLALPANIVVEAASPAGAIVTYTASANDLVSGAVPVSLSIASGSTFPLGTTTVSASATDGAGNTATGSFTVTVQDTTAPVITSVTPSRATLWPANHKMVAISLDVAATDAVGSMSVQIMSVASNEPDDGLGDGDTANDVQITGPSTLNLRAERSGSGGGRTYTITVRVTDGAGNYAEASTTVTVPRDQR